MERDAPRLLCGNNRASVAAGNPAIRGNVMNSENIIAVNVPNAISILIMAAIGGLIVAAIRKAFGGGSKQTAVPTDNGALAMGPSGG